MDTKRIRRNIGYFFGRMGFGICSFAVKLLPQPFLYGFARMMGGMGFCFAAKQRQIAIESLNIAFGKEKSKAELDLIVRDCFTFMAKSAIELLFLMDRPALLKKRVGLVNRENLEAALAKGKGAVLVSAHFGNFPLLMAKLGLEGYPISGIMRPMHDERMEKIFFSQREKLGVKTIYSQPRAACVNSTIEMLRKNGIVFIPIDQNFGSGGGVFVDFFGTKAATATGPVIFARRTGAALIPCFIVRQPDDTHKIIFEPEMGLKEGRDNEDTVHLNIQRLTGIIESYIRKYPSEWGWIHRRWKTKPA